MMAPRRGFFLAQRRPRVGALTRGSLAHLHNTDDTWVFSRFAGGCVSLVSAFFSGKKPILGPGRDAHFLALPTSHALRFPSRLDLFSALQVSSHHANTAA